jgi:peptidoglycan/LPS O-acetylase OafA/YrhL
LGAHFPAFDSFRALAALTVFLFHVSGYLGGMGGAFGRYVTQRTAGWPAVGVGVFFLISAFLLYRPFVQARRDGDPMPRLVPYGVRRILRIVPAYWFALPIVALILGRTYVFSGAGILKYFLFLQVYSKFDEQGGLAQGWTIDVEMTFYVALAVIAYLMARRPVRSERSFVTGELGMCAGLLIGSMLWQIAMLHWLPISSPQIFAAFLSLPGSFDLFAMGMALAVISVALGDSRPWPIRVIDRAPWLAWVGAAACYWALVHWSLLFHGRTFPWLVTHELRGLFAVFVVLPGVFGTPGRGWVRRFLDWRPLRWAGKTSYGFYLWHVVVITELADAGLHHDIGGFGFFLVALAVSYALGAASWYGIERRALLLGRRLSGVDGRAAADLATPAAPLTEGPPSVVLSGAPPPAR